MEISTLYMNKSTDLQKSSKVCENAFNHSFKFVILFMKKRTFKGALVMKKVAIYSLGRIGRMVFRIISESEELDLAAINATHPASTIAHLLKYDTTHGTWDKTVEVKGDNLVVDGKEITDRKSTRLNSSHVSISYAVFCLKKKMTETA